MAPGPDHERRPRANTDQLRDDIDRGRTGDKVDGPDPAAVPLGVDEEAAGTPLSPAHIQTARDREGARRAVAPQQRHGLGMAWFLLGFAALVAIGIIAAWAIRTA